MTDTTDPDLDSESESDSESEPGFDLNRRRFLAWSGAIAGATVPAKTAQADSHEYDVIRVPANSSRTLRVGSNETLENTLIDVSASGAWVTIVANGRDWTIRNVGIKGHQTRPGNATFGVIVHGTCRMENVYVGDGGTGAGPDHDHSRAALGVWMSPASTGHLDVERVNIQEMGDNSFYCSAPMHHNGRGTVHFKNCYSANSRVTHYRLGTGVVENCVAVNDHRHEDGRGVWAWAPGDVEVRNCHLAMNGRHYSIRAGANGRPSTVNVYDTEWDRGFNGGYAETHGSTINFRSGNGNNPRDFVPEGCPTSAEEAASGGSAPGDEPVTDPDDGDDRDGDTPDDEPADGYEHTITFEGDGQYYFEVHEGPLAFDGDADADTVYTDGERRGAGDLDESADTWEYDGYLADVVVDDDVECLINGNYPPTWEKYPRDVSEGRDWFEDVPFYEPDDDPGDPDEPDEPDDGDDRDDDEPADSYEHTIAFEGTGQYYFEVHEGPLAFDADSDRDFTVYTDGERRGAGVLDGSSDPWEYDGYLADVVVDDDVECLINGNYPPTWEKYPRDVSEGRDWFEDVPFYRDEADE